MNKRCGLGILFNNERPHIFVIIYIAIGSTTILTSILFYPFLLPKILTNQNSYLVQQGAYIFYAKIFFGFILLAVGLRRLIQEQGTTQNTSLSSSRLKPSLLNVITAILKNGQYFRYFWPASILYWIFFGFLSSMLIYRSVNFSTLYGVSIPSISTITYGPVGYAPVIAIYLTNHLGILVVPINLIISIAVSALVGLNLVLSIYAFKVNQLNRIIKSDPNNKGRIAAALGLLGGTTGLFTVCPTCASYYIFSLAGSLAPTIAAFAITYYAIFVVLSIPLLLVSLFISASSIRKMTFGQCLIR